MKALLRLLAFIVLLAPVAASAQSPTKLCIPTGQGNSCQVVGLSNALPVTQAGAAFNNITTNADTVVKSGAGTFVGLTVNTAGTGSTAKVYDNTACSGTVVATFSTAALATWLPGVAVSTGICVTTAGAGAANITVLYR